MRESFDQMMFVWAAYAVGLLATLAVLGWSWLEMRRAERNRDEARSQ